jgi:hypothetical protein
MKKLSLPPVEVFESNPPAILITYPVSSAWTKLHVISSENPEITVQDEAVLSKSRILKSRGIYSCK